MCEHFSQVKKVPATKGKIWQISFPQAANTKASKAIYVHTTKTYGYLSVLISRKSRDFSHAISRQIQQANGWGRAYTKVRVSVQVLSANFCTLDKCFFKCHSSKSRLTSRDCVCFCAVGLSYLCAHFPYALQYKK